MDRLDRKILECLQDDSSQSVADIAEHIGLSTTPCWRRIQKLEKSGVIRKRVALLDRHQLNLGVDVFVAIRTNQHNARWFEDFSAAVDDFPEVVEFYRMSGDIDYLMRIVVEDIAAFDNFYKRLIERVELSDVSSSFAMEQIKYTTALPLAHA
jgi:Lrp/AsnC family transcriptional regulator